MKSDAKIREEFHEELLSFLGEVRKGLSASQEIAGNRLSAFRDTGHLYRRLIDTINGGVLIVSRAGTIVYTNRGFSVLAEAPTERVLNSSIYRFISPEHHDTVLFLLREGLRDAARLTIDLKTESGALLPVLLSVAPSEIGGIPFISMVITDLTEPRAQVH